MLSYARLDHEVYNVVVVVVVVFFCCSTDPGIVDSLRDTFTG